MTINIFNPYPTPEPALSDTNGRASTGFPSPAEDYLESTLDLNQLIIKNPSSTFFGRMAGVSKDAGADNGDLLVIDKSLDYRNNALAVCCINGEFTLKRIKVEGKNLLLFTPGLDCDPVAVGDDDDFTIWGIVTYIIKKTY